ncbi:MAG: imidazole glycerol phosphate synthase subunit HisH [Bacteroidales bacterium]|nr:imidazole glycerol phosphate synthase subunit HisH [Bacteroidales bacterium]
MIAIIDYGCGNLRSVENALDRLGCEYRLTADPAEIIAAKKVILPGVGSAAAAMDKLRESGLIPVVKGLRRPVLGICVGMQVLCRDSEEGPAECMGVFDAHVRRFPEDPQAKVPHMGWNQLGNLDGKLFKGMEGGAYVYFVHSYYAGLCNDTVATCRHGNTLFSAALRYENFYGTQFHPEKSGDVGEQILKNFLAL